VPLTSTSVVGSIGLAWTSIVVKSATWLLDKKGLRVVAICGCFLNALGAWLKVACVSSDRFAVLMFAQTVCAIAQIFILGLPARLAAVWFGPNEVSTATSIGVFSVVQQKAGDIRHFTTM
jgi:hypothetical protein